MALNPEQQARVEIDRLLMAAGWHVYGVKDVDIHAARGVAVREFPLAEGHGYADYLLYVDGKAAGVHATAVLDTLRCSLHSMPWLVAEQVRPFPQRWHMHRRTVGVHWPNGENSVSCS